ncbi:unnamed protein product [Pseudo-nitzschia multistriata]|uniref:RxLR effector protein n=1 Tax=Pseudo-nitzschia multistriata TaxID=183589 RepID=A0A448Z222_9STRA|nr:unnamed protein product [Pseudo-nitzschia multistriata]
MIRSGFFLALFTSSASAFMAPTKSTRSYGSSTQTFLFDKMFEEEGMLGKGITVGSVQVALRSNDRASDTSIFGLLEDHSNLDSDANEDLARMANDVCLDLMRKSDDWVAACSTSKWFSQNDAGKAESYYNELANNIATKFDKVCERSRPRFSRELFSSDRSVSDIGCLTILE